MTQARTLGITRHLDRPFEQALADTRSALQAQGFGILTEIDVQATLRDKIAVDFRPYVILGACNPLLAHRALSAELDIGLLLPCNVVVYGEDGGSVVSAFDPEVAMTMIDDAVIAEVASEARERLTAAIEAL